ncbi:MAG: peptidase S8 [Clostridia bacterium]|nr:peptidase S8 [Clostridia bacterium]NCC43633.1 peptidase S8 [Clostridia bacterium]
MKNDKLTGAGVGVAVLDTGIYPHIDFDSRILAFYDFLSGRNVMYDDNGHGTHVAGVLAGSGAMSKGAYKGIAPGCNIIAAKVLDKRGNGRMRDVINALAWVRKNKEQFGIRILNISVGTVEKVSKNSTILVKAVEEVWDEGIVVVTAAGNLGPEPGSVTAPGVSKKVITVGSSDLLDQNMGISGTGPTRECVCKPDIVMPGAKVVSCAAGKRGGYVIKSGTSMSTPKVSGAIALALEKDPHLKNVEIKMLLKEAAIDLGYTRNQQGWGQLDIEKFLKF